MNVFLRKMTFCYGKLPAPSAKPPDTIAVLQTASYCKTFLTVWGAESSAPFFEVWRKRNGLMLLITKICKSAIYECKKAVPKENDRVYNMIQASMSELENQQSRNYQDVSPVEETVAD